MRETFELMMLAFVCVFVLTFVAVRMVMGFFSRFFI